MGKRVICLLATALAVSGLEAGSARKRVDDAKTDGVKINGVTWAARNVGVRGKFVNSPADAGRFYTFEEAQSACPAGWRTPTASECESLIAAGGEWTMQGGIRGRRFGSGEGTIFIPAAGAQYTYEKTPSEVGSRGHYWSSSAYSDALGYDLPAGSLAYDLRFDEGNAFPIYHNNRAFGYSVRCVSE